MTSNDVKSLITCRLCSELYEDPRLLPCSHTYCFRCINTNEEYFSCPSCDEIRISRNEIDSLPTNGIIRDTVQLYVSMKDPPPCAECESSAEVRCNLCNNYYCSQCDEDIHSKRAFRNHSRIPINNKSSAIPFCTQHPDGILKNWCQDCHTPVCCECLLKEHQNHQYNSINESFKEFEIKVKTNLEYIQSSFTEKFQQMKEDLEKVHLESERNKSDVRRTMSVLRQIIDEHEKEMFQHIENFRRESQQQIENHQIDLNEQFNDFHLHKNSFDTFVSTNDQHRLLKNKSNFWNYIQQTNHFFEQVQSPTGIDYHITGFELVHLIQEQILQCARVTETSKQIISLGEGPQMERLMEQYKISEEIDFTRQSLNDENIHIILDILRKAKKVILLNLSNNQIGSQGLQDLIDVIQNNQILTTLDLSYNQINDEGTKYLANFLKSNTTLTTLYLYENGITEQGIQYLSDALKMNTKLEVLDLQSNSIGNQGAFYLAELLRKNNVLTTLYLANTQIGNQGALSLAEALQKNKRLTGLALWDNQIDHQAKRCVLEMIKTNKKLGIY